MKPLKELLIILRNAVKESPSYSKNHFMCNQANRLYRNQIITNEEYSLLIKTINNNYIIAKRLGATGIDAFWLGTEKDKRIEFLNILIDKL